MTLASIGLIGFIGAIIFVANTSTAHKDFKQNGSGTDSTDSSKVLGSQSLQSGSPLTGQNGNQGASGAQQSNAENVNGSTSNNVRNGSSATSSASSYQKKPPVSSSPSTSTPSRTGYNLNESWYLATAGAEGLFNSCWPTALDASNEAQCIDENNPYSHHWFEGVGISKSAAEAQELAAAQVQQKANEKHVDLRRGGGGDAVILNESLCSTYGLVCGRW